MTTETPAALLRRAAEHLRTRASEATPGPWEYDGNPSGAVTAAPYARPVASACNRGLATNTANARHIAAMHSGVGLALADWLQAAADMAEAYPEMAHDHDRPACEDYACDVMGRAIETARVVLGGVAE